MCMCTRGTKPSFPQNNTRVRLMGETEGLGTGEK